MVEMHGQLTDERDGRFHRCNALRWSAEQHKAYPLSGYCYNAEMRLFLIIRQPEFRGDHYSFQDELIFRN